MMALFESRSVANLLARNFSAIRMTYQALAPDEVYDEFVDANEEILRSTPDSELKVFLDGLTISIYGGSESMSRLHSLQYAYLLTRYAEKAASQNRFENALMVLSEACYFSGFAEGLGMAHVRQSGRSDTSLSASHAAKVKHARQSQPLKQRLLELLASESRPEKWKSLTAAIRKFEDELRRCISDNALQLNDDDLPRTIASWRKRDSVFGEALSKFINSKA